MLGPWIKQIGSVQTGDGKSKHQHSKNQRTKMDWRFMILDRRQGARPAPKKRNAKKKKNVCLSRPYK